MAFFRYKEPVAQDVISNIILYIDPQAMTVTSDILVVRPAALKLELVTTLLGPTDQSTSLQDTRNVKMVIS